MSAKDKLVKRLNGSPKDFTWDELMRLLGFYGFEEKQTGKTGGSRRKFFNESTKQVIHFHKPHPGTIVKMYVIRELKELLLKHA
ncbi:MAG: type II toxin-antitoxin system HicA family toxin [Cytophagales bacterium]|nr:MAG: type II toxin-antitoxin system HicA family toxin [Cytophagales bacterium]